MITGYTTGAFDLFHVGHLNILRAAKGMCDRLIVGVSTDDLVFEYKGKRPEIPCVWRTEIVRAVKYVDVAFRREVMDKVEEWRRIKFNVVFVGDDWYQNEKWEKWEAELEANGVEIIYLPNTPGVSTSRIIEHVRSGQ